MTSQNNNPSPPELVNAYKVAETAIGTRLLTDDDLVLLTAQAIAATSTFAEKNYLHMQ